MPLYSMFCMAKPAIGRAAVGSMMRLAGTTVLSKGGVLTDIVSFGQQDLAYDIRNQGVKYSQARGCRTPGYLPTRPQPTAACYRPAARRLSSALIMWQAEIFQMDFMVDPVALEDLEHNLKVDERVLRYVLQKKDPLPRLPTTYKVSKLARALRERQLLPVSCGVQAGAWRDPAPTSACLRSPITHAGSWRTVRCTARSTPV